MIETPKSSIALVRQVPADYQHCIRPAPGDPVFGGNGEPIDVGLAKAQHDQYCHALSAAGLQVVQLPAQDHLPDSCFTEDPATVFGQTAVISSMKFPSRVPETETMLEVLRGFKMQTFTIRPPATLEGGDVVKAGKKIFVGLSDRTNLQGIEALQKLTPEGHQVIPVPLHGTLHLGTVCQYLGEKDGVPVILYAPGFFDPAVFKGFHKLEVPPDEAYAANAIAVNGTVIMPSGYPKTKKMLIDAGYNRIVEVPTSEIRKGGGSLTCLSKLIA